MNRFKYQPDRFSASDGSDAMFVRFLNNEERLILINECGESWEDDAADWLTEQEAADATWTKDDRGCWTVIR